MVEENKTVENKKDTVSKKELSDQVKSLTALLDEKDETIEKLSAESSEYKDKWYRTTAEFENFKKRNAETRKTAYEEGQADIIKKILFIGDNLERALTYSIDDATKEGLQMLLRQYGEIMANLGLEEINPVGETFDPNLHEAVFSKPAEEGQEIGIIDSVFLKGYKQGKKIIRYAQVVVTQ